MAASPAAENTHCGVPSVLTTLQSGTREVALGRLDVLGPRENELV